MIRDLRVRAETDEGFVVDEEAAESTAVAVAVYRMAAMADPATEPVAREALAATDRLLDVVRALAALDTACSAPGGRHAALARPPLIAEVKRRREAVEELRRAASQAANSVERPNGNRCAAAAAWVVCELLPHAPGSKAMGKLPGPIRAAVNMARDVARAVCDESAAAALEADILRAASMEHLRDPRLGPQATHEE